MNSIETSGRCESVRSAKAFTLIELLVTISIVAILAALTFVCLKSALVKARLAVCSSNLRQIGSAVQLYLRDRDNVLPQRYYEGVIFPATNAKLGYDELLLTYIGNEGKIFQCPSQTRRDYPVEPSYGMNWYYDNTSTMRVENAGGTILATDTRGSDGKGSHRADRNSQSPGELDSQRHNGKANYLFFDGHVELLRWEDTVTPDDKWGIDYGLHNEPPPSPYDTP